MLKLVYLIILVCDLCNIVNSLNETDEGVCTKCNGSSNLTCCCYNYELINGSCVVCQTGFINRNVGSSCIPCADNLYGKQCLHHCKCELYQRCDHVHGCLNETITTEPIQTTAPERMWSTAVRANLTTVTSLSFSNVYTRIQNITPPKEITGLLQREIVIYSVVIGSVLVTIGLTSLLRKYRKKSQDKATNPGIPNTNQSNSLRKTRSRVDSASSLYAEIDETMLIENADIRTWQAKTANEEFGNNDNTSYLSPVHSEGDNSSFCGSEKGVNRSYLSFHESDQNQNSDEFDKDDDATSYLHPYHSIDEDWKEKTHQYDVTHALRIEVDDSSDSSTQMINDGYLNPYQPLSEDWKQPSHSYEVPVTNHKFKGSSCSSLLASKEDLKGEDTKRIENDLHNKVNVLSLGNSQNLTFEENSSNKIKPKTTITDTLFKPEKNDAIVVSNDPVSVTTEADMNEISACFGNIIDKSRKCEDISKGSLNDCCNTHIINKLDSDIKSDVKYLDNSENNTRNFNILNEATNKENDSSILNETKTNVHDYTDAKSQ